MQRKTSKQIYIMANLRDYKGFEKFESVMFVLNDIRKDIENTSQDNSLLTLRKEKETAAAAYAKQLDAVCLNDKDYREQQTTILNSMFIHMEKTYKAIGLAQWVQEYGYDLPNEKLDTLSRAKSYVCKMYETFVNGKLKGEKKKKEKLSREEQIAELKRKLAELLNVD